MGLIPFTLAIRRVLSGISVETESSRMSHLEPHSWRGGAQPLKFSSPKTSTELSQFWLNKEGWIGPYLFQGLSLFPVKSMAKAPGTNHTLTSMGFHTVWIGTTFPLPPRWLQGDQDPFHSLSSKWVLFSAHPDMSEALSQLDFPNRGVRRTTPTSMNGSCVAKSPSPVGTSQARFLKGFRSDY